jgi:tRNA (mo5U34)-methyltransferase
MPRVGRQAQDAQQTAKSSVLEQQVRDLGPWFHNLRLGPAGQVQTAPEHPLGDFPSNFWTFFRSAVPADLSGQSVLDIGCNAGFYSFEMKRRGAARVLGIDHDETYLTQARFARDQLGMLDVEFRRLEAYDVDELNEQFDLVIFMGVLYHLRHPLYALEKVAALVRGRLLFQTMERGSWEVGQFTEDYPITERDVFFDERYPRMYFVEGKYAGDPTNWWIPNPSASLAMLRSVGMRIVDRPCHEVYVCEPNSAGERADRPEEPAS